LLQGGEHSQRGGSAVDMNCDRSRPSSGRVRQSPMEIVRPDLAAQIIEDALSPTPLQNVNVTSSANGHISHRMLAG